MPFMVGRGALRRTIPFLEKGKIILRNNIKIVTFQLNPGKRFPHHSGLYNFVFWHLPQLQYKNPEVQMVTFKHLTPTPWIRAYFDDDSTVLIDCDSRSREEIHDHVKRILGKSEKMLDLEKTLESSILANPGNFGPKCNHECMCEIPGQIPCPLWQPLPKEMTGKYKNQMRQEQQQT